MDNLKTEWQKMIAGEVYDVADPEVSGRLEKCRELVHRYNALGEKHPDKRIVLNEIFGRPLGTDVFIQSPFFCDYGVNIQIGKNFYANFDCVILDGGQVFIGDNVLFAPKVQLYTAFHPTDPVHRSQGLEMAQPIRIGNNVWVGGGAIVLPGVAIGDNTIIGAGSVVTKDVESDVVAAGNPCRVIRKLDPSEYGKRAFL